MTENIKAFPDPTLVNVQSHSLESLNNRDNYGMDLRDYFAGLALQGLMAGRWKSDLYGAQYDAYTFNADKWAGASYKFADAMMKARER